MQSPDSFVKIKQNKSIYIFFILLVILPFISSCGNIAKNITSMSDLKPGHKILAGRISCYENDEQVKCVEKPNDAFVLSIKEFNSSELIFIETDDNDYFYVGLPQGEYAFSVITKLQTYNNPFNFKPNPMPTILINHDDSIVNLGTLELRFNQSIGSKIGAFFAYGRAKLKVEHIANYDTTTDYIQSNVSESEGSIRNIGVVFKNRLN